LIGQKKNYVLIGALFFSFYFLNQKEKIGFMRRCLQLARLGCAKVAPNPMVGCVLVHPRKGIIGEGWHQQYGGAHAEVNAINTVADKTLLQEATAFVNLEPCSHFGKTPPCADLIIEKGIPEVIICNTDPNPLVSGRGIKKLQEAGVNVEWGLLENEGLELNRFFFTAQKKSRPFVTLKWAQTQDSCIARDDGSSKWISSPQSRLQVHKMRAKHQAIMAGRNTLRTDNPSLNVRNWIGRQPIRIICDPNLSLSQELKIFTDENSPTWVFNNIKESEFEHLRFIQVQDSDSLELVLEFLWKAGIHSIFVEGGTQLLNQFIQKDLWDEALVFSGPIHFQSGLKAPQTENFNLNKQGFCGPDLVQVFTPVSG